MLKIVSDLRQIGGFLRVLRFPPLIKLTATEIVLNTINTINYNHLNWSETDLERGVRGVRGMRGVRGICYTTLIKQFNKLLFHERLTRDL
jgi:hypothetical protein